MSETIKRLELVKAHRGAHGSDLKTAIAAVDAGWAPTDWKARALDAEAELSRLQSPSDQNRLTGGWRDIASAPDETFIDLFMNGQRWTDFSWCGVRRAWIRREGYPEITRVLTGRPTHWMPIEPLPLPGGEETR